MGAARTDVDDLSVEVEVRGKKLNLQWRDGGAFGDPDAIKRLLRGPIAPKDPVSFLRAVQLAFGHTVISSVGMAASTVGTMRKSSGKLLAEIGAANPFGSGR